MGVSRVWAVVALLLNLFVLPGLGTLIAGRVVSGVLQIVLMVVGGVLSFILVGIPIVVVAWVWALVSSLSMLRHAH